MNQIQCKVCLNWKLKGTSTLCCAAHSGKVQQGCVTKVVPCHKCMWMLCWLGCGMPFDAAWSKIRSANCRSHQKKPRGIWWVSGFKMVSASLRKKSDQVCRSRSTVLVTWRSAKNYFFMWTRLHWRHMPSNMGVFLIDASAFYRPIHAIKWRTHNLTQEFFLRQRRYSMSNKFPNKNSYGHQM